MRRVLRHLREKKYATETGEWAPDPGAAKNFPDVAEAAQFAVDRGWKSEVCLALFVDEIEVLVALWPK
jgi:predicted NUDIX family NTP pyrophosphohydrolase